MHEICNILIKIKFVFKLGSNVGAYSPWLTVAQLTLHAPVNTPADHTTTTTSHVCPAWEGAPAATGRTGDVDGRSSGVERLVVSPSAVRQLAAADGGVDGEWPAASTNR